MYPLPDEDNKGPDDISQGFNLPIETSHKGEAKARELDYEVDFPYQGTSGSREEESKDFTDDLHYEENIYNNTQNEGKNIYFFMGSIPNGSEILKDNEMKNDILLEVTASDEDLQPGVELHQPQEVLVLSADPESSSNCEECVEELESEDPEIVEEIETETPFLQFSELPGAPPGSSQIALQLNNDEDDEEEVESVQPETPKSKWDWKQSFPNEFLPWIAERFNSCPKHTGWDVGGLERAYAHINKLDSEIGRAIREDLDGHLDAKQIDGIRKQLEKAIDMIQDRLDQVNDLKKSKKTKKKASDEETSIIKEAKISSGVLHTSVNIPYLISALAQACIMSTVSAGHDMEEIFFKVAKKFKLDDREKYQLRQCIADMGFQMQFDGTTLVGEDADSWSQDNGEFMANYTGKNQ